MVPVLVLGALLALAAAGCHAGGDASSSQQEPQQTRSVALQGVARFADPSAALRFSYPDVGLRVAVDHFDPGTPPGKFKHEVTLWGVGAQAVTIDVWNNTEKLSLADWFEKYLGFTRKAGTVQSGTATAARVPAFIVEQPRSPQSQARRIVVFAQGDRVFRVTCHDTGDAISLQAHKQVLESFDGTVTP